MNSEVSGLVGVESAKFCVNCEHVASSISGWDRYQCFAPENLESKTLNLVTGQVDKRYKFATCNLARNDEEGCGKVARWYKQKEYKSTTGLLTRETSKPTKADEL